MRHFVFWEGCYLCCASIIRPGSDHCLALSIASWLTDFVGTWLIWLYQHLVYFNADVDVGIADSLFRRTQLTSFWQLDDCSKSVWQLLDSMSTEWPQLYGPFMVDWRQIEIKGWNSLLFHSKVELTKSFNLGASCASGKVVYKGQTLRERCQATF